MFSRKPNEATFVVWLRTAAAHFDARVDRVELGAFGPGHPDLCLATRWRATPYKLLLEAKVHDGGRVGLSPSQIAWHVRNARAGKPAFILAYDRLVQRLRLFDGSQTTVVRLATKPAVKVRELQSWTVARKQHMLLCMVELIDAMTAYHDRIYVVSREWPDANIREKETNGAKDQG